MGYDIDIQVLAGAHTAVVARTVALEQISSALVDGLTAVRAHLASLGVDAVGPPFARYSDYRPDRVDVDVGVPVAEAIAGDGDVRPGTLPGGEVVHTTHRGSLASVHEAVAAMAQWLDDHGREGGAFHWEVYTKEPNVTEVFQPLA